MQILISGFEFQQPKFGSQLVREVHSSKHKITITSTGVAGTVWMEEKKNNEGHGILD
jgi:hypothetical protein